MAIFLEGDLSPIENLSPIEQSQRQLADVPQWLINGKQPIKIGSYQSYFLYKLRTRYVEIEADLRTIGIFISKADSTDRLQGSMVGIQKEIVYLLMIAKEGLEKENPDLISISNVLDLVSRYKIWMDKYELNISQAQLLSIRLRQSTNPEAIGIATLIENEISKPSDNRLNIKGLLDEALGWLNREIINIEINNGLQIQRLKLLRKWALILVLTFTLIAPITANFSIVNNWPFQNLANLNYYTFGLVNTIGIVAIGAAGAFFSGLLQVRSTKISLQDYQENMLKLQLKPLVGSFLATVIFIILSWQILPAIKIENVGTFIFISFLCGYSERYFLKMLELKSDYEPDNYAVPKSLSSFHDLSNITPQEKTEKDKK